MLLHMYFKIRLLIVKFKVSIANFTSPYEIISNSLRDVSNAENTTIILLR